MVRTDSTQWERFLKNDASVFKGCANPEEFLFFIFVLEKGHV